MEHLLTVGRAVLYAEDVTNFLRAYTGRPFDLTVTSPPYSLDKAYAGTSDRMAWTDYLDWLTLWGRLLRAQTAERGRLALNVPIDANLGGHRAFAAQATLSMLEAGWRYETTILWDKGVITNKTAYGSWMLASAPNVMTPAEAIIVFSNGDWKREHRGRTSTILRDQFMEWRTTVWRIPGASAKKAKHPAPFPTEIPQRLIQLFSFEEDLIFDPFVGSGTTCEAAERLNRASIGVDQSADYLRDLAVGRIQTAEDQRLGALTDSQGQRWENLPLVAAAS